MDWEQGRLSREDSEASGNSQSQTSSTSKKAQALEKLQEIEDLKVRLERGDSVDLTEMMGATANDPFLDNKSEIQRQSAINPDRISLDSMSSNNSDIASTNSQDMNIDDKNAPPRDNNSVEVYSEFVQRLVDKREGMREVVNQIRRRPTALDLWP